MITIDFFSLPYIGCVMVSSYVNKLAVTVTVPVLIIGGMAIAVRCGKLHPHQLRRNSLLLLFLAYPSITSTIIGTFACLELADGTCRANFMNVHLQRGWITAKRCNCMTCRLLSGTARLEADLSVVCDQMWKHVMHPLAGGLFVFYAIGAPVVFGYQLYRHREVLHLPGPKRQLGFLYSEYRYGGIVAHQMPIPCTRHVVCAHNLTQQHDRPSLWYYECIGSQRVP